MDRVELTRVGIYIYESDNNDLLEDIAKVVIKKSIRSIYTDFKELRTMINNFEMVCKGFGRTRYEVFVENPNDCIEYAIEITDSKITNFYRM